MVNVGRDCRHRLSRHHDLPDVCELRSSTTVGEEAVMANPMNPIWQAVDDETANELVRIE